MLRRSHGLLLVMRTDDFDYNLPPDRIAQHPLPRGESRLLVLSRSTGHVEHRQFPDILEYLAPGHVLVVNDTRVSARRVQAELGDGREGETLLLRPVGDRCWDALVRPGKRFRIGARIALIGPAGQRVAARVLSTTVEGGRLLETASTEERDLLISAGTAPLPPYITANLADESRYQTVYAAEGGSAAAPTAGLHFTEELLETVQVRGIKLARVTLHVGIDTFRPLRVDSVEEHRMHGEWYSISAADADLVNARQGRLVAVGTTTVRALESAAGEDGFVQPHAGDTRLFIYPGYRFKAVQAILTNFHLPKSTLLMMVSAFAGRDNVMAAYQEAVRENYRFYSFGDAMLII